MAIKANNYGAGKSKLKINHSVALGFITLLVIISVIYILAEERRGEAQTKNIQNARQDLNYEGLEDLSTKYYDYKLIEFGEQHTDKWDQKLIRSNKQTGKETVVVKSVKEAIPELKKEFNLLLTDFVAPENSKTIYFQSVYSETSDSDSLYSFDVDKVEFKKMKISEVCNKSMGGFELSPNQTEIICAPYSDKETGKSQTIYLANLANDSYQEIVKLPDSETFNAGSSDLSAYFDIRWTDDNKIRYSVYNWLKVEEYSYAGDFTENTIEDALIEYRECNLS